MILAEINILIYNRTQDEESTTKVTSEHRSSGAIVEIEPYPRTPGGQMTQSGWGTQG